MNKSKGDSLLKDNANSLEAVRNDLISTNESHIDNVVRENTIEKDVIIVNDIGESCDIVHGISASQVEIVENETTANSLIPVVSGNKTVLDSVLNVVNDKRNECGMRCDEQFHDRECNRIPLQKVTCKKDDTYNSANNAQKKVHSSDVDSSDDENLPLSKPKILNSKRHDKGQVENQIYFTSDAYSTLEGTKYNGEGDGTTRVVLCLWKNTDLHMTKIFLKLQSLTMRVL